MSTSLKPCASCVIFLFAMVVVWYFSLILFEINIAQSALFWFLPFLVFILVTLQLLASSEGERTRRLFKRYAAAIPRDSTSVQRVIRNPYSKEEIVITGSSEITFREALISDWRFDEISKRDRWYIVDDQKNDISENTLESYHRIAEIMIAQKPVETYSEYEEKGEDTLEEYSSVDEGVEFYD